MRNRTTKKCQNTVFAFPFFRREGEPGLKLLLAPNPSLLPRKQLQTFLPHESQQERPLGRCPAGEETLQLQELPRGWGGWWEQAWRAEEQGWRVQEQGWRVGAMDGWRSRNGWWELGWVAEHQGTGTGSRWGHQGHLPPLLQALAPVLQAEAVCHSWGWASPRAGLGPQQGQRGQSRAQRLP